MLPMNEPLMLIPFGPGDYLALSPTELAHARDRAREILGAGWAGDRAAAATTQSPDPLLTAEQISEATGVQAAWFLEQARRGEIPHVRLGKYRRFVLGEVVESARFRERAK